MLNQLIQSFSIGWQLCRLKTNTSEIPHFGSNQLIINLIIATIYAIVSALMFAAVFDFMAHIVQISQQQPELQIDIPPELLELVSSRPSFVQMFVINALLCIGLGFLLYLLLLLRNKSGRFSQTFVAIMLVNIFITLAAWALLHLQTRLLGSTNTLLALLSLANLLVFFVLVVWQTIVSTVIIRDSTELPSVFAFLALMAVFHGAMLFASTLSIPLLAP